MINSQLAKTHITYNIYIHTYKIFTNPNLFRYKNKYRNKKNLSEKSVS